jgi:hypothetical protein
MRRMSRESNAVSGPSSSAKGTVIEALKDVGSADLQKLAKKLGNDDVQALMGESRDKRDQLLQFIHERLSSMDVAQKAEQDAMKSQRVWWDEVAKGKPGFTLPDPTRWRHAAELYRKATEALQGGNLGRAADIMKSAIEADRAAFEALPTQVKLPADRRAGPTDPATMAKISSGEGCPVTRAPQIIEAADRISSVTERAEKVPGYDFFERHNWWEAPEEEAEQGKGETDKKKKGKKDG